VTIHLYSAKVVNESEALYDLLKHGARFILHVLTAIRG